MGRAPCCDKSGMKRGPWTPEEDVKLVDYIQKHGHGNWRTLPKNAGLQRCGKSCRLRWTNYLRPDIKRGRFSFDEEETIIQLHAILGNKWSAIAARLPGRTDNEIKNYWNTNIRKRLLRMGIDPVTHAPRLDLLDGLTSFLASTPAPPPLSPMVDPELLALATHLLSAQRRNPDNLFLPDNQLPTCSGPAPPMPPPPADPQPPQAPCFTQPSEWQVTKPECFAAPDHRQELPPRSSDPSSQFSNGFGWGSVVSPATSSPTQLNSNSTYVSTEDERGSYCSDVLGFEMPDMLDVGAFFCDS